MTAPHTGERVGTPTPWAFWPSGLLVTAQADGSITINSRVVAKVTDISQDDMAFLLRACNAHDALLTACQAILATRGGTTALGKDDARVVALRSAISLATGEQP